MAFAIAVIVVMTVAMRVRRGVAAIPGALPQIPLTRHPKARDQTLRVVLMAFRTLTLVRVSRRSQLLEIQPAILAMIFIKGHKPSIANPIPFPPVGKKLPFRGRSDYA
jgi:hypothetical protein